LTIKPNTQNTKTCIQSYCINSSQILLNTKDHQVLTVGCPNTHATIPRGQAAAILENRIRNRSTDFEEIWHSDAHWPPTGDRPLKFQLFKNPRWRPLTSRKSQKSRYLSNGLTDLHAIWHDDAKWVS